MVKKFLSTATIALLAACQGGTDADTSPADVAETQVETAQNTSPELGTFGIELDDMNTTVDPGDDFFRYVNGKWLDTFEMPDEFSNYGAFTVLFERSEERVKAIIGEAAEADAPDGSIEQKIGDYYNAFLDTDTINAKGLEPIQAELDTYDGLQTLDDVAHVMARPDLDAAGPFRAYVDVDNKNPDQYTVYISQSGLGMPNRDFYLAPEFADKREAYMDFLSRMLEIAGVDAFAEKAEEVFALEKRMAEVHWEPAKRRNADLTYNLYTLDELSDYAPQLPWADMLEELKLGGQSEFVVRENDAIQNLASIFADTEVETWRNYLKVHALRSNASVLPDEVDQASFDFYGKALSGTPVQRERWKRGVSAVNGALGEAVGHVYVDKYFPPESKVEMEKLVDNLKIAFLKRLETNEWMTDATKEEARKKLAAFTTKIGYPDQWTDYSALEVKAGDAYGNNKRSDAFDYEEMIAKLGQPIDKTEWFMTPQTVNAYYSRNRNEIVFPAAILQAPFFDPNADPAVNYGGIGAVIGHEIGHGFDDQGRKADGTGMQRDWWQKADADSFQKLADQLGAQYATYSPVEGHFVRPELTMGENIGDLGGLRMAYEAYKLSLNGEEAPVIDGYTGDQRFFMAWAQVWKRLYREDELKRRLVTDSHSPSEYRTNGIVRNMDPWYDAFDVSPDDDLYLPPEERVQIW
ncbi:M13 family metallopeptidase [Parvularcula sp. LCG005]|uniref:M13 family metallopeptidase n=1 Tax=Parvularcula sp. LCG005 TaxID=3078805 RepID=UPI002943DC97|nr:M13 family metallopeptidase [Parvularcula sp. LCG005]WOI53772.1 M13 family metallopeptidase [Parvularcula sp. LCG005]